MPTRDGDRELGRATWTDVAARPGRILLVPVGSCEQHGPHLPLDTDTRIALAVAHGVAAGRDDATVAPAVTYGASGEHQSFAGTLSIGSEALVAVLVELGRSAFPDPATPHHAAMVFVNGHGGNRAAVRRATDVLTGEGRPVASWAPAIPGGDAHAGRTETSLLLAIAPEVVRADRPAGASEPIVELADALRSGGVGAVSANGVLGDATGATAAEGHAVLAALIADCDGRVRVLLDRLGRS